MNQQRYELTIRLLTQAALAFSALAMFYLMTGCNPYAVGSANLQTATPSPAATATNQLFQAGIIETPTPRPACVIATGYPQGTVNMRSGAGTSFAVIGLLREGDRLTVIRRGAWLQVETPQHMTGWVNSKFCK